MKIVNNLEGGTTQNILCTSAVLIGLMLTGPTVRADDDMDDMGPVKRLSQTNQPTQDFDLRSGQNSGGSSSGFPFFGSNFN